MANRSPAGAPRAVQPLELGVVRAIHVRDGQSVAAGEVLVELDATAPAADRARLAQDLAAQRLDAACYAALAESSLDPLAARAGTGLTEALRRMARLEQDLAKARRRENDRTLRAPVAGTVHDVAVDTIGGVVAPVQRLMSVIPADAPLAVDASLLNKDADFVRPGQRVAAKIESFPFTRYGPVPGEVTRVSADAVDDPALGLVYPLRASLAENRILAGDRWVPLAPGMAAAVEVATGKRRAIDFFLSPFRRYTDEALRER